MVGTVITFYSYKGGVGRSFALANIATILAQWGSRVLLVDWDIEAPGLRHYFSVPASTYSPGVLGFIVDCQSGISRPWHTYTLSLRPHSEIGRLELMPATADGDMNYTETVQRLDWDTLYERHGFGARLEDLRSQWISEFDFVLVDSRTGVTDFSGLTTAQLPDILAFLFTANSQSLDGCAEIVKRAMNARRSLPFDRPALVPLPIPARFDQREEYERANTWRGRFASTLEPFFENWVPRGVDHHKLIDLLTIPYVPRWTFGEDLAAVEEVAGSSGTRAPAQAVSYAFETVSALLVRKFVEVELLLSSRDEYVHTARIALSERRAASRQRAQVFLSYSTDDADAAQIIAHILGDTGISVWASHRVMRGGVSISEQLREEIEKSDAYLLVLGHSAAKSKFLQYEIESIRRHALRSTIDKPIIPLVLPSGKDAVQQLRLSNFQAVSLDPNESSVAQQLAPVVSRIRDVHAQRVAGSI